MGMHYTKVMIRGMGGLKCGPQYVVKCLNGYSWGTPLFHLA
jgi:hypothetical protein